MILIVEDEDFLRETLSRFLAHQGHEVISAASGSNALDLEFEAVPEVLIADWMLKDEIHGLHVAEAFRGLYPGIATILITGFPSRDLLEESSRCGVSSMLEKPFALEELRSAVEEALSVQVAGPSTDEPIAALAVRSDGTLGFASERAVAMLALEDGGVQPLRIADVFEGDGLEMLALAEEEWVSARVLTGSGGDVVVRSRRRRDGAGWFSVLSATEDQLARRDPRVATLLDVRSVGVLRNLDIQGPIVVLERDGVVRRLLVSQIERLGAICYASDGLDSALRLVAEESRIETVLVDFMLAGSDVDEWVSRIRAARSTMKIIGTGVVGAESDLRSRGIDAILRKPWRIDDLVTAIEADAGGGFLSPP